MSRPNPIQYAERLYAAIRAANFSPLSFLTFGNAVKDGVELRRMPRIAAEPFMRVVGEMLDFEEQLAEEEIIDGTIVSTPAGAARTATGSPSPGPLLHDCAPGRHRGETGREPAGTPMPEPGPEDDGRPR